MSVIRRLQSDTAQFTTELRQLLAFEETQDASIENACREILHQIRQHGDSALVEFTQRFDGVQVQHASELEIHHDELQHALHTLDPAQRSALEAKLVLHRRRRHPPRTTSHSTRPSRALCPRWQSSLPLLSAHERYSCQSSWRQRAHHGHSHPKG